MRRSRDGANYMDDYFAPDGAVEFDSAFRAGSSLVECCVAKVLKVSSRRQSILTTKNTSNRSPRITLSIEKQNVWSVQVRVTCIDTTCQRHFLQRYRYS